MCTTCGCGTDEVKLEGGNAGHGHGHEHVHADGTRHSHEHEHSHAAEEGHGHSHAPGLSATRRVQIEQDILSRNNAYAHENRQLLAGQGIFALNLVSGPGSGKTTLLCKTIIEAHDGTIWVRSEPGNGSTFFFTLPTLQ